MSATLELTIWGVNGGAPKTTKQASCTMLLDPVYLNDENYINADAFVGKGDNYRRREECIINVTQKGKSIFAGTFDQLCNIILKGKEVPTPLVLIEIEGGTLTSLISTQNLSYSIIDHDCSDEPEKLSNLYEPDRLCSQSEIATEIKNAIQKFSE